MEFLVLGRLEVRNDGRTLELSLGIYPLIWGFKSSPILKEEGRPVLHPAVLAR
jgi:hypothetical protein